MYLLEENQDGVVKKGQSPHEVMTRQPLGLDKGGGDAPSSKWSPRFNDFLKRWLLQKKI